MKCCLCMLLVLFLPFAQVAAQDSQGCNVPLQLASHDVSVSTVKRAADDYRYDNECASKSESGAESFGISYQGVGLSAGSSNQSTDSFCKGYVAQNAAHDASYQYARTVVREALGAFLACKQLESRDIKARFRLSPNALSIDLSRLNHAAIFKGVVVTPEAALQCEEGNPQGGAPLVVDHSTRQALEDGETLVITCRRTDKDPGEGTLFDAATLTVDTTQGSASIDIAASRYPPPMTTDQLLASINDVATLSRSSDAAIAKRVDELADFASRWQQTAGSAHQVTARAVDYDRQEAVGCPGGEFVTAISQRSFSGQRAGGTLDWITVTCAKVPVWSPTASAAK